MEVAQRVLLCEFVRRLLTLLVPCSLQGRALKRIGAYCREVMHRPIKEQWEGLKRKVQGHYGYYGITGNAEALGRFRYEVTRIWRYWLGRRGAKGGVTWEKMHRWLEWFPLPQVQVVHSVYRLAAKL